MNLSKSENGECLYHPSHKSDAQTRLAGNYADCPSGHLWIGPNHRLSRSEVREFAQRLMGWVETGTMESK